MTSFGLYPSGNRVAAEAEILFRRLDPKEVEAKLNAENAAAEERQRKKRRRKRRRQIFKFRPSRKWNTMPLRSASSVSARS